MTQPPTNQTNRLLGYPDDARLLILNADDFGMIQAINEATLRAFRQGILQSTTLMVPCPWALHAMHLLRENPDIPFGVHLTVLCDSRLYKWRPLVSKEKVPSLIDEDGYYYSAERTNEFLAQADLAELELEFRAQIEIVLNAGLKPTHLDWHCLHNGGRADVLEMTLDLAKEYHLAIRVYDPVVVEKLQAQGLPADDHEILDSFRLEIADKSARYAQMLRDLPPGLTEWAVHPGLGNAELQAIDPETWSVRQTDFDFLMSQETQQIIKQEGIILLSYRPLQAIWNKVSNG